MSKVDLARMEITLALADEIKTFVIDKIEGLKMALEECNKRVRELEEESIAKWDNWDEKVRLKDELANELRKKADIEWRLRLYNGLLWALSDVTSYLSEVIKDIRGIRD